MGFSEDEWVDILVENKEDHARFFPARLYASAAEIKALTKYILDKSVIEKLPKVTGYPTLLGEIRFDKTYKCALLDKIRQLSHRELYLNCTLMVEGQEMKFYFPPRTVQHFCAPLLKGFSQSQLPFNSILGKIFSNLLENFFNDHLNINAKVTKSAIEYVKEKEFLEFVLSSSNHRLELFVEKKGREYVVKWLGAQGFSPLPPVAENKAKIDHIPVTLPVELGVVYLSAAEFKNLSLGDIIVFDKTCLNADSPQVDKAVVNLNGLGLEVSLGDSNSCQVTHFIKDW